MEVKHQVFVSSTYRDLEEERRSVIHALLELDCIPAGMELFPATDEDAWSLIKEVIDGCDYYILVIAAKYGSIGPTGVSYTEMEFDYAVAQDKPIIAFLHENPEALPSARCEKSEPIQQMLAKFRDKANARHCKFWTSPEDLGGKVSRSLVQLRKRHPSPGWVPGKFATTEAMLREIQELRAKLAQCELDAVLGSSAAPVGAANLAQGSDKFELDVKLKSAEKGAAKSTTLSVSWDLLFSYVGPSALNECTDEELMEKVQLAYFHAIDPAIRDINHFDSLVLPYVFEDRIRVQFQALGLMAPGSRRRPVSDGRKYWRLTPYGEKYLLSITAEKRPSAAV
jgi:hypothetical protein